MFLSTFSTQLPTFNNRAILGITGLTLYLVSTVLYLPRFLYLLRRGGNSAVATMCNISLNSLEVKLLSAPNYRFTASGRSVGCGAVECSKQNQKALVIHLLQHTFATFAGMPSPFRG